MFKVVRGTKDIFLDEIKYWQYVEENFKKICKIFNYQEIRTPIFEETEVFIRSIGLETDIVEKEMYTFLDKKGRNLALRPEETAPVIRAYVENSIFLKKPLSKFYYIGPMFRYDRPQAGRYRQFHQLGVEAIGDISPYLDLEIIILSLNFLENLGLKNFKLFINSIGCKNCRVNYQSELKRFLEKKLLCNDCNRRLKSAPIRILDCKNEGCKEIAKGIPEIFNFLCDECSEHFEKLKDSLTNFGIEFQIDPYLVRGLDYYTKTCFEIKTDLLGAQNSLIGGGRYDELVKEFGGPDTSAVGFAAGEERIVFCLKKQKIEIKEEGIDVLISTIGDKAKLRGIKLLFNLRRNGLISDHDFRTISLKSQLRYADKLGARFVIIIGEDELKKNIFLVKDLKKSVQFEVSEDDIVNFLLKN